MRCSTEKTKCRSSLNLMTMPGAHLCGGNRQEKLLNFVEFAGGKVGTLGQFDCKAERFLLVLLLFRGELR